MNEGRRQQNYMQKGIEFLFVFVMTQYFGALGQYSLVLNSVFAQLWSNLYMIAKIMLIAFILVDMIAHKSYKVKCENFLIIILIILIGCISIYKSGIRNETVSFTFRLFLTITIGIYVATKYSEFQILRMLKVAQTMFLILTIVFIGFFPKHAFFIDADGRKVLLGIYTTKNPCAFELVFGVLLFYIGMRNSTRISKKVVAWCMIGIQIALAFQCRCVGAILTGMVTIIAAEFLIQKKNVRLDYLYMAINIGFFVVVFFLLPFCVPLLEKLGRDITLTGRTNIWLSILQLLKNGNYLFGYGYESFWNNESITRVLYNFYVINGVKYNYTGAHNTIIELLLYFGIIGIIVYLTVVLSLLKKTSKFEGTRGYFVLICFFFFTIHGVIERSLSDSAYDTMIFVMMLRMNSHSENFQ